MNCECRTVLSLFSSAGIGELGIRATGLKILISNELLKDRAALYKENYPEVHEICGDIWEKKEKIINQGQFDGIVRSVLRELEKEYPEIHYAVVLAYLPGKKNEYDDFSDTIFPEGIEAVHPRYAVDWRNRWMLQRADFVVTYIAHSWGGAAKFAEKAKRDGKTVINIFRQ